MTKFYIIAAALIATLAAPFILRPRDTSSSADADVTVVIVTPHSETIRYEFAKGFTKYVQDKYGKKAHVDWRTPGVGTSEIERYVSSLYRSAFKLHWRKKLGNEWSDSLIGDSFSNKRLKLPEDKADESPEQLARRTFLESDVGIGIDIFFGGGAYPFQQFATRGYLVDSGVFEKHPEWAKEEIIPKEFSGEPYYDSQHRWIGSCISSFGICYNPETVRLKSEHRELKWPHTWDDLGDPRYFRSIAIADPTKSGSVTKAFEMLIQQKIRQALDAIEFPEGADEDDRSKLQRAARELGWKNGLNLIQDICANARYFTDSATKIPLDVAQGDAAAGMCIDFYGRTYNELLKKPDGTSRVEFVIPERGTSMGVDPIAMFRGADKEASQLFIEFVLSKQGQKLWNYKVGTPGGPEKAALRRLPVRKDMYTAEHLEYFSDPDALPFDKGDQFEYVGAWTGPRFGAMRFIVQVMCLDIHHELQETWSILNKTGFPERATNTFHNVTLVDYNSALTSIRPTISNP
ncbi:MAG: iron(III) transport system substrate-binding protein, partial [Verrucomicrobiales bacterium]